MTARPSRYDLALAVNGEIHETRVRAADTLLTVLRRDCALTGAKRGCNQGVCGACTVLIDGLPTRACLTLALECRDRAVTTVEGVASAGKPTPLQRALAEGGAVQCGFCTPGIVMTLTALLRRNAAPTLAEVREALAGNLCRCSGYAKIVEAALDAAGKART